MQDTVITRMLGIRYPLLAAPMFLVSNVEMVVALGEAGALGAFPALNLRTTEEFRQAVREIKARTPAPFGVNLILLGNERLEADLAVCLEEEVHLLITSLGNPTSVIQAAHARGLRVFCDVTNLKHALKCQEAGADAVIAVASGAGGHAGTISPFVLVPHLQAHLSIPVVAAGGISDGRGIAAALALGAGAAYVGTRFIASHESPAPEAYKRMILESSAEDIEYSPEVSGHPANFLRPSLEAFRASQDGEAGAPLRPSAWRDVWSAGHGVSLISEVAGCRELVRRMMEEYEAVRAGLPSFSAERAER